MTKKSKIWLMPKEEFAEAVADSTTWTGLLRIFDLSHSGNTRTLKARVQHDKLNTSHFNGTHSTSNKKKYVNDEILCKKDKKCSTKAVKNCLVRNGLKKI
jgi:hypothetical protein